MEQPQLRSKLLATPKEREKLIQQVSGDFFRKKLAIGWMHFIRFMALGLAPLIAIVLFPGGPIFMASIAVAVLVIVWILPVSYLRRRLKLRAEQSIMWKNLDRRYGSVYAALAEIKRLFEDAEIPLYSMQLEEHGFYIIGEWYIDVNGKSIICIAEMAAIVSGEGNDNFIIFDNESVLATQFEKEQWSDIFNLFRKGNLHILHFLDSVTLPNGDAVDVKEAHKRGQLAAIVAEYNERKAKEI